MENKDFVAVCVATSKEREGFFLELLDALDKQTYGNFRLYKVKDITPIGKAKHDVVELALQNNPKYICMLDDDDLIEPTYLEKVVARLDQGDIDWCFTWGKLFGDRTGYIHGEIQTPDEMLKENHQPAWISAKAELFKEYKYNENTSWAEDRDLWIRLWDTAHKGAVIEEELYLKRWHDKVLTITHQDIKKPFERSDHYRFHILGYVHLPCSREYMACAFTMKNWKLSKMLMDLGHEVYYYGAEGSDMHCTEFIQTHTLKEIRETWGDGDNRFDIGYDWHNSPFRHDFNAERTPLTKKFYSVCIDEINKRKRPDDFLLVMQGYYHKPIADKVNLFLTCEPGIGYRGSVKGYWRAFESSYMQNFTYGSEAPYASSNGSYYDRVIPNYFDPQDFEFCDTPEDYYLYIGRMIQRKGVWVAVKATEELGARLLLVGQQDPEIDVKTLPKHCEFLGFADVEKRKELMSHAIATYTPTTYLEAFAGTHIESMLSGTPPITTNYGVFPGTIPDHLNGKVGFRCNTLQDFVDAGRAAQAFTPHKRKFVYNYGKRFLMENVMWEFNKWFDDLYQVYLSTDGITLGWNYVRNKEK